MKETIYTSISIDVSATLAAQILEREHPLNRKKRPALVRRYSEDMLGGAWIANPGEPLMLASDDTLLNGHHRLSAVLLAAKSDPEIRVPMFIMRNVPKNVFTRTDRGKARSFGDNNGVPKHVDTAINLQWRMEIGLLGTFSGHGASDTQKTDILLRHAGLKDYVDVPKLGKIGPGMATFLLYNFRSKDPVLADEFQAAMQPNSTPRYLLLQLVGKLNELKENSHHQQRRRLLLIIKTWNALRAGVDSIDYSKCKANTKIPVIA